jgi:hypothetical protein
MLEKFCRFTLDGLARLAELVNALSRCLGRLADVLALLVLLRAAGLF